MLHNNQLTQLEKVVNEMRKMNTLKVLSKFYTNFDIMFF